MLQEYVCCTTTSGQTQWSDAMVKLGAVCVWGGGGDGWVGGRQMGVEASRGRYGRVLQWRITYTDSHPTRGAMLCHAVCASQDACSLLCMCVCVHERKVVNASFVFLLLVCMCCRSMTAMSFMMSWTWTSMMADTCLLR
jgi:hypothetical protein